jgi:hypothetical protein
MAGELRDKPTIFDVMVLVAASALGAWGASAYRAGIPLSLIDRPGLPVFPLLLSVPVAAALTWGTIVVPVRSLRERVRRLSRQPGTVLCVGAAVVSLGVVARWSLRAWITPFVDGSPWVYGARILYESASWCGLGALAAFAPLILEGKFRRRVGWIDWVRFTLTAYWLAMFAIFSIL